MTDEIVTPEAAPAETPAVVETAPVVAPVVETPAENPVESPVVETPVEEAKPDTLLGGEKKPAESEVKLAEVETAPVVAEEPAPVPTYEPFTFPEGIVVDESKMGDYTKTLAEFETASKASHEEVQKLGQVMLERHVAALQDYTQSLTNAWNKQKNDWKDAFLKDPEFANRSDTVVNSAIDAISVYGGDAKQQEEFRGLMEQTGAGNHPAMIRLLSNIMIAKTEPKPLAAPLIVSSEKTSKMSKMYGKKTGS